MARAIGINFSEPMKLKLVLLSQGDDRSVGWLVRQAVAEYLERRSDDILRYAAQAGVAKSDTIDDETPQITDPKGEK